MTDALDANLKPTVDLSHFIANDFDRKNEVSLVTFHYNPARFKRLRETYYEWLPSLGPLASRLRCYELVFDDDEPEIEGSIVVRGTRSKHGVWQKEAIVNLALRETPPEIKYFGWVDHDVVLSNLNWMQEAVDKIDAGDIAVQLFQSVVRLNLDRTEAARKLGAMADPRGAPGGMWLADRAYMDSIGGLNVDNILGGGDQTFYDAMVGIPGWHMQQYSEPMQIILRDWIAMASDARHGRKASYTNGTGYHLWHGDQTNRQYATRNKILIDSQFNSRSDLRIAENGLLEWASEKPQLPANIDQFFKNRREDG